MSYGVGLALLWLWHRPEAVAPLRPLAWEPPYALGAALKKKQINDNNNFILIVGMSLSSHNSSALLAGIIPFHLYIHNFITMLIT